MSQSSVPSVSLLDRNPAISVETMLEQFVPPFQFQDARLETYIPDDNYPSQSEAIEKIRRFVGADGEVQKKRFFSRPKRASTTNRAGLYLDGGFGVGKTHLLASIWHIIPGRTFYGTFIEFTALVGAMGYEATVQYLTGAKLLAIDEFELDDPGDTMVMTRLLGDLVRSGTKLAATSNTPPAALGEGRFAAEDFLREISSLAENFETVRIDGDDFRRRDSKSHALSMTSPDYESYIHKFQEDIAVNKFDEVLDHLSQVHPSLFASLVGGLRAVGWEGVRELTNQAQALRLVALVDRLYDARIPIVSTGLPLDQVFDETMLSGGYRKKYLRAISQMVALTRLAVDPQGNI